MIPTTDIQKEWLQDLINQCHGPLIEVPSKSENTDDIRYWSSGDQFADHDVPEATGTTPAGSAEFAMWLFGPEYSRSPGAVMTKLSELTSDNAVAIVASSIPWPHKILPKGERAEYTTEEIEAAFTRSGFKSLEMLIEGPFFNMWSIQKLGDGSYHPLLQASALINEGKWEAAEAALGAGGVQFQATNQVVEYALMIAACHRQAGRTGDAAEAYMEALNLDPACARAMCALGNIAALSRDLDTAEQFFSTALNKQPALADGLHGYGLVLETKGEFDRAFDMLTAASALRPYKWDYYSDALRVADAAGKSPAAKDRLWQLGERPSSREENNTV